MTRGSRSSLYVLLFGTLFASAQPSLAQPSLQINAQQSPGAAGVDRQQVGKRYTFICPASDGRDARVYGTDVYTENSQICPAAIHAGVLQPGTAGVVSIILGSGSQSFEGTERNGVTSLSYGPAGYSYTFAADEAPATVTWRTTWNWNERQVVDVEAPIVVECPAGKPDGVIYGDDVYTLSSPICVAAVHAGAISAEQGGVVAVMMASASSDASGGERFGITSRRRSATAQGFRVAAATPPAESTVTTPEGASPTATTIPGSLIVPQEVSPPDGVTLSAVAPSATSSGARVRDRPVPTIVVQNPASVTASVTGIAVTLTWSPVQGASWYGIAGYSQDLWRNVAAPTTSVKYYLPFGQYTFAVGGYFEPGTLSTPAGDWPRVTASVVRPQTPQQIAEYNASVQQALIESNAETIAAIAADKSYMTDAVLRMLNARQAALEAVNSLNTR